MANNFIVCYSMHTEIGVISIKKMQEMLIDRHSIGNDLILSDRMSINYELFKHPFRLDGIVLGLVTSGEVVVFDNLNEYEIKSGMFFIVMPDNILQLKEKSDDFDASIIIASIEFLSKIHIDIHKILPLYVQVKTAPFMMLLHEEYEAYLGYFSLLKAAVNAPYFQTEIVEGLGLAFSYTVTNIIRRKTNDALNSGNVRFNTRKDAIFEKFIWLLLQYYEKERRVGFYANEMHLTEKHLSMVIKEVSGKTAAEWVDEYVILEAKTRVRHSGLSIQQVAFSLNFPSATFFSKYFKSHTGITPGEYRRQ